MKIRVIKDKEDWGEYFHDKAEIHVSSKAFESNTTLVETLRHEILEASLHIGGTAFLETYQQEAVVRCIEGIFFPAWDKFSPKLNCKQ